MNRSINLRSLSALFVVISLIATVIAYLPGLHGPLLTDDIPQLKGLIDHSADPVATLIDRHLVSNSGQFGRSVVMATFIANAAVHGPDLWWWKLTNLVIHLGAGLLVFWLTVLLVRATSAGRDSRTKLMAAVVAAIWLLHPLHISTVLYTVQRMTELSAVFVLAGLICYVQGRLAHEGSAQKGWLLIGAGFGVFFPLALLSKESALLFPVYCTLIELSVFGFRGNAGIQRQIKIFQGVLVLGYVVAGLFLLLNFSGMVLDYYAARDFTFAERVLTEPRVIVLYIAQLLRPIQSKMGFFHDDLAVSTGFFDPVTTVLSIAFLVALITSAILLRKRLPLYTFGILFFFVAHALESTVFALELMFEHRNYIASYGIIIALVSVAQLAIKGQRASIAMVAVVLLGLSFLTHQRAVTWSSPATMYDFMYYAHPKSPRLNFIFADIYSDIGDYDRARLALANIKPGLGSGIYALYLDCLQLNALQEDDIASVSRIPGGKVDGHVIANTKMLAEAVIGGRCTVPKRSIVPLIDQMLTLPYRSTIDHRALLDLNVRLKASAPN